MIDKIEVMVELAEKMKAYNQILFLIIGLTSILWGDYEKQRQMIKNNINFKKSFLNGKEKISAKLFDSLKFFSSEKAKKNHFSKKILNVPRNRREEIEIFINGEESTSITQGEDFIMTVYFSDDSNTATVQIWVDMNENGTLEEDEDFLIQDNDEEIIDNDIEDENPAEGVYQKTFYAEDDGPNNAGNLGAFFAATDSGGSDVAYLFINALTSDYSVSGDITPPVANIVVAAFSQEDEVTWMVMTDSEGASRTSSLNRRSEAIFPS